MNNFVNFLPYRIKRFIYNYLLKKWKITTIGIPSIVGDFPDIANAGTLILGKNCCFRSYRLKQRISVWKNATLTIGNDCFFNDAVTICSTQSISIGSYAKIGDQVHIYDSDFHQVTPEKDAYQSAVSIGRNVWVGAKSIILAGSSIGDNSVIAAGSTVKGDIPKNCVAAGSPAKVIKYFDAPDNWIRK